MFLWAGKTCKNLNGISKAEQNEVRHKMLTMERMMVMVVMIQGDNHGENGAENGNDSGDEQRLSVVMVVLINGADDNDGDDNGDDGGGGDNGN